MGQALGLVESAWFFRRGNESVRIVRVSHRNFKVSLQVDGPGESHVVHRFDDQAECAIHQSELERRLVRRDFHLERTSGFRPRVLVMPRPGSELRLLFATPSEAGFGEPGPFDDSPSAA
jgi:hypothetical protein